MSLDFQILYPVEAIPVSSVRMVPGSSPPVLDIIGTDFSSVDEISINDIEVRTFVVVSRTRLLVTLTEEFRTTVIQSVSITSRRLTISEKSFLRFRITKQPSKVSGILRLVQLFVKVLLTTPGTDIFNKKLGGGLMKNLGRTFGKSDTGGVVNDVYVATTNVARQILAIQGRQPQLPADERLLDARVIGARFNAQESALLVSVEITSMSGRSALANLVV